MEAAIIAVFIFHYELIITKPKSMFSINFSIIYISLWTNYNVSARNVASMFKRFTFHYELIITQQL